MLATRSRRRRSHSWTELCPTLGVPNRSMAHWAVVCAGWVAPVDVDGMQARIDHTAKHLPVYRSEIEEIWLLISADGLKPSQLFEVREDFDPTKVRNPFDRTYFYSHPGRAVVELGGVAEPVDSQRT